MRHTPTSAARECKRTCEKNEALATQHKACELLDLRVVELLEEVVDVALRCQRQYEWPSYSTKKKKKREREKKITLRVKHINKHTEINMENRTVQIKQASDTPAAQQKWSAGLRR